MSTPSRSRNITPLYQPVVHPEVIAMGTLLIRRKLETILECDEGLEEESVASSSLMRPSCQPPRSKKRRLLQLATSIPAKDMTFHDFRTATIEKYPSFSFLGPASMAVYWCKLYLKTDKFGWIHYSSPPPSDLRKRSIFWHIPGQYLTDPQEQQHDYARWRRRIGDVLSRGEPGVHYATSYVGIYNLLRMFGRYGLNSDGDVVLLSYDGPDLPPPTLTTSS
jgi:hypothetical protein